VRKITSSIRKTAYLGETMNNDVGKNVEFLLAQLNNPPSVTPNESQTQRSEILEEILRLVALALDSDQKAIAAARRRRRV
jgi:hypothetical protein